MKLGDTPAFPSHGSMGEVAHQGMSLRQHYAGLAMQSLLTSMYGAVFAEAFKRGEIGKTKAQDAAELRKLIVEASCTFADELCAALEKQP